MKWYYVEKKKSVGPFEEAHLHLLVKAGALHDRTMVYSEGLAGWTPYALAFAPAPPAPSGTAKGIRSPAAAEGNEPEDDVYRKEVARGILVGAGMALALTVLLSVHAVKIYGASHSQDGGGGVAAGGSPEPRAWPSTTQPPRTQIRLPRDSSGVNGRNTASPRTVAQVARSSILGRGLRKDDVERILTGKTRRDTVMLLGMPDTSIANGTLWRYSKGVQVYDPGLDLTFFAMEIAFKGPSQPSAMVNIIQPYLRAIAGGSSGTDQQMEDTITTVALVSIPPPQRGQIR